MSSSFVLDGVSDDAFAGHVLIADGRIVDVIRAGRAGAEVSDLEHVPEVAAVAEGSLLAPGFVDIHSHSDLGVIDCPSASSKIAQGVTTEVVGNCGFSAFPEPSYWLEPDDDRRAGPRAFNDAASYFEVLRSHPRPSNIATLAGAGAIRARVVGVEASRPATAQELDAMCAIAAESVRAGALGVSMGLMFSPGCYAPHFENVAVATAAQLAGARVLAIHMRDEGTGLLASVLESVALARESGLPLHISHLKAKGRRAWGLLQTVVEVIREIDHPISFDFYPYSASMSTITSLVPPAMRPVLADSESALALRSTVSAAVRQHATDHDGDQPWRRVRIAHAAEHGELAGLDIETAANQAGMGPEELIVDLWLASSGRAEIVNHCMDEAEVDQLASIPDAVVASDGFALPLEPNALAHPRSFGAFPVFLRRYVFEQRRLGLPEAIKRMTSVPARIAGLHHIGSLRIGNRADLVVIDPVRIGSPATYEHPRQLPTGIVHQVVGGELVMVRGGTVCNAAGTTLVRDAEAEGHVTGGLPG